MLLSHSKKFIFIHVYKVAGTSITKALNNYNVNSIYMFRPYRFLSSKYPGIFPNPYKRHISAIELKNKLPSHVFNEYFKFGFVRNPWDWHLSLYSYTLMKKGHHQAKQFRNLGSFEAYVKWLSTRNKITLQKDFFYDHEVKLVDFIGKMENLNEDFAKVCRKINVNMVDLPHLNKSNDKKYQEFYNEKTKNLIYRIYKKDIELFEYEF